MRSWSVFFNSPTRLFKASFAREADGRRKRRVVDKRGRVHPVRGDRRAPSTTYFGKKLKDVLEAAGVKRNVTIHGLRRTFAVLLQEAGAPDSVIGQALGHKRTGVTQFNYLPRRDVVVQRWVNRIQMTVPALEQARAAIQPFEVVDADVE